MMNEWKGRYLVRGLEICVKARSHSALRLDHGQNPSNSCREADDIVRIDVEF